MITSDILYRVFRIGYNGVAGSAFTIEKDNVQYIVTAKHLFENVSSGDTIQIEILREKKCYRITANVIFHSNPVIDCAVLITNPYIEVTGKFPIEITDKGLTLGQDVFFLGFPYNYDDILMCFPESKTPVPFIKKACLSGLSGKDGILFLDGINNHGFSGGPVCFQDLNTKAFKIAGVINSYRNNKSNVFTESGIATSLYVLENTGIINACSIRHVMSIIDSINYN